jgi:hypothetical protein
MAAVSLPSVPIAPCTESFGRRVTGPGEQSFDAVQIAGLQTSLCWRDMVSRCDP